MLASGEVRARAEMDRLADEIRAHYAADPDDLDGVEQLVMKYENLRANRNERTSMTHLLIIDHRKSPKSWAGWHGASQLLADVDYAVEIDMFGRATVIKDREGDLFVTINDTEPQI